MSQKRFAYSAVAIVGAIVLIGSLLAMSVSVQGGQGASRLSEGLDYELTWNTIDGGGVMFSTGGDFELSGTVGQPDAGTMSNGDIELTGGFWVGPSAECDTVQPFIVHGYSAPPTGGGGTWPCTGYIDPRIESDNGIDANLGVNEVILAFSEPVCAVGGALVDASSFDVIETGPVAPPNVASVEALDPVTYKVTLDRLMTLGEWTTVRATIEDECGNPIVNNGNRGPGEAEPDRIDIGCLPGDVNQDGIVSPLDLINLRQFLTSASFHNECDDLLYFDSDRDGVMPEPQDLLRFRQILTGASPATQSWALQEMNRPQP